MAYEKIERAEYVRVRGRIAVLEPYVLRVGGGPGAVTTLWFKGSSLALGASEPAEGPAEYILDPELISPQLRSEI